MQYFDFTKADTLFSRISLPTLTQEQIDLLESPITDLEVAAVIKATGTRWVLDSLL